MTSAAIYLHPEAFDTTGKRLMGRHSAGESFLRGLLRHGTGEHLYAYNAADRPRAELQTLMDRIQPGSKPAKWIGMRRLTELSVPGGLHCPSPELPRLAWTRQPFGDDHYSLCGITHTTASKTAMDIIADMVIAPVQPWDGLICTSRAVRASVDLQMEAVRENLAARLGATKFPTPQLTTIPLGVNAADYEFSEEHRQAWRSKLDVPNDAIVALYVGRFSAAAKMNPAMMAMTLEAAAAKAGKPIYWVVAGWAASEAATEIYHRETQALCPSIHYRPVDGRSPDTRFSIWSVADFFISFSDNIQETFGLTPVEAMAAGLPCVVTDWDGYRDTVRHGLDGFRIRTFAPRAGLGGDLAYQHANAWLSYELYLAAASQMTGIDHASAVNAIVSLIENPDLRMRMAASARDAARQIFDWSVIVPQYEAFWTELNDRRLAAKAGLETSRPSTNPRRLDPFTLFADYPTETISASSVFALTPGMTVEAARKILGSTFGATARTLLLAEEHCDQIVNFLAASSKATLEELLARWPVAHRGFVERGLLWLVKFDVIRIVPPEEGFKLIEA